MDIDFNKDELIDLIEKSIDIDFDDVLDFLNSEVLSQKERDNIMEIIGENNEIDFDDVMGYLDNASKSEIEELTLSIQDPVLQSENLYDEQKLNTLKVLYNNMTLKELENVEKNIKVKII